MLQPQAQEDPFSSASSNQMKESVPQKWDASGNQDFFSFCLEPKKKKQKQGWKIDCREIALHSKIIMLLLLSFATPRLQPQRWTHLRRLRRHFPPRRAVRQGLATLDIRTGRTRRWLSPNPPQGLVLGLFPPSSFFFLSLSLCPFPCLLTWVQDSFDGTDSAAASTSGRSRDMSSGGASRLQAPYQEDDESLAKTQLANSIFGGGATPAAGRVADEHMK